MRQRQARVMTAAAHAEKSSQRCWPEPEPAKQLPPAHPAAVGHRAPRARGRTGSIRCRGARR